MNRMIINEKTAYKLLAIAVFVASLLFVGRIVYAGLIALPYPNELLEPSNVALTNQFIEGNSPYSLASLSKMVPGINYDYPFLNSLFAAVVSAVFRCNAVTSHFIISLFSILLSGVLGFFMVKRRARTTVAPMLAALMFMFCHWRFGYISAAPDDLGLAFLLLAMLVSTSEKITNKPFWTSILITLCFYTKQYYVFIAVPIFIYFLLYSRKEAFKLLGWTLAINISVGLLISLFWPLYWIKAFLLTVLGAFRGGGSEIGTLISQLRYLIVIFAALFVVLIFALSTAVGKLIRNNESLRGKIIIRPNDIFCLSVVVSLIMLVPLFVLGMNDGAFLSYFLQLWMPSIVVVALISIENMIPEKHERLFILGYAMMTAFTIFFGFKKLPLQVLSENEIVSWEKAYEYTEEYGGKGFVFYSRSLAYDYYNRGNGECICGHDGEVHPATVFILNAMGFPMRYFAYTEELVDQNINYRDYIKEKASNHEYSLITFEKDDRFTVFDDETCEELGYKHIDTLELQLGNMPYEVEFYAID